MKLKEFTVTKTLRQTLKIRENFRTVEVGLTETYTLDAADKVDYEALFEGMTKQLRKQMGEAVEEKDPTDAWKQ